VIAQKSFWQCDLLGCDDVFHMKWQMPRHTRHLMQDESGFTVGNHSLAIKEALGRLDRAGSVGSVTAAARIMLTIGKGIFNIRFLLGA